MNLAGENGVAAFGTIMYVNFIFIAIFLGYSIGSAPLVSYHYGAGNHDELKKSVPKKSAAHRNLGTHAVYSGAADRQTSGRHLCRI